MVFLKAQLAGRMNDPEFLIKCLVEYIESDITKAEKKRKVFPKDEKGALEEKLKRRQRSKRRAFPEKLGDRRLKVFDKPKKLKDTPKEEIDITGEDLFLALNNKTALRELKTILKQPETKKYLSRLKQVAVKFPYDGLPMKGGKVDKNSTEYKNKLKDFLVSSSMARNVKSRKTGAVIQGGGAKGMGATREVNLYLSEALTKLKDESKDVKVKRKAAEIMRMIKNRNEEMMEDLKVAESQRKKIMGTLGDDSSKLNKVTKSFWTNFAKEFKEIGARIKLPLDGNETHNSKALAGILSYGGEFVVAILDLLDRKMGVNEITPQKLKLPKDIYDSPRSTPEWMQERDKTNRSGKVSDALREAAKVKKASDSTMVYNMIDISKAGGKFKIAIRQQPYNPETEGHGELIEKINLVSNALKNKKFKEVKLIDIIKRFAEYSGGISPKARRKSSKEDIQNYMADRKKEIMQGLKLKKKVKKIPKVLIKEYDELTEEIVSDLRKYYSFTMDTKPKLDANKMFQRVTGKNVTGKSHGKILQEAIDSAKEAEEKRMLSVTEEDLKEYSENEEMLSEANEQLELISGVVGNKNYLKEIKNMIDFVEAMIKMQTTYRLAKVKISRMLFDPSAKGSSIKVALTAKRDLENEVLELLKKFNKQETLSVYIDANKIPKPEQYTKLIETIDLDFDPKGEESRILSEFEFDAFLKAFDEKDLSSVKDLYINFGKLETKSRRLYAKSKEIEKYLKTATQEREEVSLLQQFFEIKRAKMAGEKIKEKPKMLDVLTQRFKANPIFDEQGKEISSIADIAKYLEKKYEKVIDLEDDDLEDFISSWKEHAKEEGKRLKTLNEKIQGDKE
tara:strand:+ start:434 stop:2977 length:2544 start_codon:yes stop_codon:yes gene_type:complete